MPFEKGNIPWNRGLTKKSDERVAKMAELRVGFKFSDESRRKMSKSHMGQLGYWTGHRRAKWSEQLKGG